jgi:hypothetical protein
MNSEWGSLRLAAKASDREKASRERWPAVETQLRQWGYPSWGIAQAHLVLSGGGSVNEVAEALRSDEEVTQAGRAHVRRLQRIAWPSRARAHEVTPPAISAAGSPWLDDRGPADERHRGTHGKRWSPGHELG